MARRLRVEVARTIDRPADVVFRALTDERESPHWREVDAADYDVGGPCVVGAKFWRAAAGQRAAFEVTSCEPHSIYAAAAIEGDAVEAISCRSIDQLTTEVERVVERAPSTLALLARPWARWRLRRRLGRELDRAARWLEASAPG